MEASEVDGGCIQMAVKNIKLFSWLHSEAWLFFFFFLSANLDAARVAKRNQIIVDVAQIGYSPH